MVNDKIKNSNSATHPLVLSGTSTGNQILTRKSTLPLRQENSSFPRVGGFSWGRGLKPSQNGYI